VERDRRRWAIGTVAVVFGTCLAAVALAWAAAPDSPTGHGPVAEQVIVDACTRGRGGEGRDGCRCAYERLAAEVPWDRAAELDRALSRGDAVPEDIEGLVAACWTRSPAAEIAASAVGRTGDLTSRP